MTKADPHFESAVDVANYMLEITGRGLIDNDVEAFVERFALPLTIGTYEGQHTVQTVDELVEVLRNVRAYMRDNNVDLIVRHNINAHFVTPDEVSATHESRYLCRGQQVGEATLCHGMITRIDGVWKVTSNEYAVSDAPQLNRALLGQPLRVAADNTTSPIRPALQVSKTNLSQGHKT